MRIRADRRLDRADGGPAANARVCPGGGLPEASPDERGAGGGVDREGVCPGADRGGHGDDEKGVVEERGPVSSSLALRGAGVQLPCRGTTHRGGSPCWPAPRGTGFRERSLVVAGAVTVESVGGGTGQFAHVLL